MLIKYLKKTSENQINQFQLRLYEINSMWENPK